MRTKRSITECRFGAAVLAGACIVLSACSSSDPEPSPPSQTLVGRVFGSEDGRPLANVEVTLVSLGGEKGLTRKQNTRIITDREGRFEVPSSGGRTGVNIDLETRAPTRERGPEDGGYIEVVSVPRRPLPISPDEDAELDLGGDRTIRVPAGSVTRPDGGELRQPVIEVAAPLPDDRLGIRGVPGDGETEDGRLIHHMPIYINPRDEGGDLRIPEQSPIRIERPIVVDSSNAVRPVELWRYDDERGLWESAGTVRAVVDPDTGEQILQGDITEAGWYSLGEEVRVTSCIRGCVADVGGDPAFGAQVRLSSRQGEASSTTYTRADGCFAANVTGEQAYSVSVVSGEGRAYASVPDSGSAGRVAGSDPEQCINVGTVELEVPSPSADSCVSDTDECGDSCQDIAHGERHCGECGGRCGGDELCLGASCVEVSTLPPPLSELEPDEPVVGLDGGVGMDGGVSVEGGIPAEGGADAEVENECDPGYAPDSSGTCVDVDECAASTNPCGDTECENVEGSFGCGGCDPGYEPDSSGACVDIDECTEGLDGCTGVSECVNATGSYGCECPAGYRLGGSTCVAIDECSEGLDDCDSDPEACVDLAPEEGGYACGCPEGYAGDGVGDDGCVNINECAAATSPCDQNPVASCGDTVGSFSCTCPANYSGDGVGSGGCAPQLTSFTVSHGRLTPAFDPDVHEYTLELPWSSQQFDFTPSAAAAGVTLSILRGGTSPLANGEPYWFPLEGVSIWDFAIEVTAGNGTSQYAFDVIRERPVPQELVPPSNQYGRLGRGESPVQELFSRGLDADGTTFAVGASEATGPDGQPQAGRVLVYENSGGTWALAQELTATNPGEFDAFGSTIALRGDLLAIGAVREDGDSTANGTNFDNDLAQDAGAVYLYRRSGGTWNFEAYLKRPAAAASDYFGTAIAIDETGTSLVVGASGVNSVTGAAYLFTFDGSNWTHSHTFEAAGGEADDALGSQVWIGATIVIATTPGANTRSGGGVAWRYLNDAWSEFSSFAATGNFSPYHGESLAVTSTGEQVFLGGPYAASGSVDEFVLDGIEYVYGNTVLAPSSNYLDNVDEYGTSVAVRPGDDLVVVGATGEDGSGQDSDGDGLPDPGEDEPNRNTGALYLFRANDEGSLVFDAYLKVIGSNRLGHSVAFAGDHIIAASSDAVYAIPAYNR